MLINSFCNKLDSTEKRNPEFLIALNNEFPQVFSESLSCCMKTKVKFKIKGKVKLIFKPTRNVPFSSLEVINKELERLEKVGVIEKVNYSDCASLTVYMKKKKKSVPIIQWA